MNNERFVTAREIAEILKKAKTSIIRRAEKEGWPFENGKNRERRYRLDRLPIDVQKAFVLKNGIDEDLLPILGPEAALVAAERSHDLTVWSGDVVISQDILRNPKVGKWARAIQEAQQIPRDWKHGKRKWIEQIAKKYGTTHQTIYRYINRYKKRGISGLAHIKSNRKQARTWTPEALDWWIGLVLKKEHRKLHKHILYAILRDEARRRGWQIGGYRSALWWLNKKATPQLLALQRGSLRALDNTLPPVLRDYSDLQPFEIVVGDQHRFDFWVMDEETGEVFRPEGYFWQDLRTRCFYGGALDRRYDSHLMGLALRMGLKIFGPFDQIYTDHGKPEESRYIMGILKEMRNLGLQVGRIVDVQVDLDGVDPEEINPLVTVPGTHRKAIVRNAKAKMIESTFHIFETLLRDQFRVPGHVKKLGGLQEENEVDEKEIERQARSGKLLTFNEFLLTVFKAMDFYNAKKPHRGVLREWAGRPKPKSATPMDVLKACCLQGWKPVFLSEQAVDLLFLARAKRLRVVDRGRVAFKNEVYEHERLIDVDRKKVELRFDPMDPEWVLVFHQGEFVCRANPVEYSSMKDKELAKRKIEQKRRLRKRFVQEYRQLTTAVPDVLQYSETPKIEKAAAQVGKEQRARSQEIEERNRVRSEAEVQEGIARIEAYRPEKRRPIFMNEVDRYRWCLDALVSEEALSIEDQNFMREYEENMSAEIMEYWDTYKVSVHGSIV